MPSKKTLIEACSSQSGEIDRLRQQLDSRGKQVKSAVSKRDAAQDALGRLANLAGLLERYANGDDSYDLGRLMLDLEVWDTKRLEAEALKRLEGDNLA